MITKLKSILGIKLMFSYWISEWPNLILFELFVIMKTRKQIENDIVT